MRIDEQYQVQGLIELRGSWMADLIGVNPEVTASASAMKTSAVEGGIGCKVGDAGNYTNIPQKQLAIQSLEKERYPLAQQH